MKVLLINGSPNQTGCTYTALHEVETTLQANGIETELLYLGKKPIAGCIACGACMNTGHCFRDDLVQEIQKRLDEFDAIVIGSPVYYSAPTGQLVSFLNRLFFATENRMAGKLGASVVSCRRGGASATFEQLNQYFTIANYYCPIKILQSHKIRADFICEVSPFSLDFSRQTIKSNYGQKYTF